jgi:hypothetical protein
VTEGRRQKAEGRRKKQTAKAPRTPRKAEEKMQNAFVS